MPLPPESPLLAPIRITGMTVCPFCKQETLMARQPMPYYCRCTNCGALAFAPGAYTLSAHDEARLHHALVMAAVILKHGPVDPQAFHEQTIQCLAQIGPPTEDLRTPEMRAETARHYRHLWASCGRPETATAG